MDGTAPVPLTYQEILTRLTLNDELLTASLLKSKDLNFQLSHLDRSTHALVRIAALLTLGPATPSYSTVVAEALDAGATREQIVGVLIAIAASVGLPRVITDAPTLALALGFDVDEALEQA